MNILDSITSAHGGAAVQKIATQFGIPPEQARAAMGALMPAVAAGLKRNAEANEQDLTAALDNGQHEKYIDQPDVLTTPDTAADGNAILGHIFGSKDASRNVADGAAGRTGIDPAILRKMLPIIATLAMGALAKQKKSAAPGSGAQGGIASMLEPLLDRDRDGSIVDDVGGMLGGFLNRRS